MHFEPGFWIYAAMLQRKRRYQKKKKTECGIEGQWHASGVSGEDFWASFARFLSGFPSPTGYIHVDIFRLCFLRNQGYILYMKSSEMMCNFPEVLNVAQEYSQTLQLV